MGILSGLKRCGAAVFGGVKKVKDAVAGTAKKVGKAIASGYKSFSGQKKFEEARDKLEALVARADKLQKSFDKKSKKLHELTCQHIEAINSFRKRLQGQDFNRFMRLTSVFSHWTVDDINFKEASRRSTVKMGKIRDREELFEIDFDRNPILANAKAIFTLGFWTRKKADNTLKNVQQQAAVLEEEAAKLDAELARIRAICKSLKEVVDYFTGLHGCYGRLLDELEYSVHYVRSAYLLRDSHFFDGKFDVYYLPKRHLLCLMAAEKLTRIMFAMGSRKYLDSSLTLHETDVTAAKADFAAMKELQSALAA